MSSKKVVIKKEVRDIASPDAVQVDVDGSGLIEFHEFVKFIVSANKETLLEYF